MPAGSSVELSEPLKPRRYCSGIDTPAAFNAETAAPTSATRSRVLPPSVESFGSGRKRPLIVPASDAVELLSVNECRTDHEPSFKRSSACPPSASLAPRRAASRLGCSFIEASAASPDSTSAALAAVESRRSSARPDARVPIDAGSA